MVAAAAPASATAPPPFAHPSCSPLPHPPLFTLPSLCLLLFTPARLCAFVWPLFAFVWRCPHLYLSSRSLVLVCAHSAAHLRLAFVGSPLPCYSCSAFVCARSRSSTCTRLCLVAPLIHARSRLRLAFIRARSVVCPFSLHVASICARLCPLAPLTCL